VGLLVGAAAVGIGVGMMQIPEAERNNLQAKAHKTMSNLHDKALDASDSLSSSCTTTYNDSGVAEQLPHCLSGSETVIKGPQFY
jgi:thiamine monophosphate kinase